MSLNYKTKLRDGVREKKTEISEKKKHVHSLHVFSYVNKLHGEVLSGVYLGCQKLFEVNILEDCNSGSFPQLSHTEITVLKLGTTRCQDSERNYGWELGKQFRV